MKKMLSKAEKVLARYLGSIGMSKRRILWIMGSLPTEKEIIQMLEYIEKTNSTDPAQLYSYALKMLENQT